VISRKKAGKQTRTIIVSVPKEEEEMVDVGMRPRKRGRSRKTPNVDPLDPRKGSDAILGKGGTGPKGGDKERQLSPDRDRDKT
jgi:hypothetical protein